MSVKGSRLYTAPIPKMPPGLVELMEGLAKDVLMYNPSDVYAFCAEHMKKLLLIRDGPTPKRVLTLEQKIAIANKKVRDRAARRREEYDKKMQDHNHAVCQNESDEMKPNDQHFPETGKYIKNKIVKIPEEDLCGDIEHEIIAKPKEINNIDAESVLVEKKSATEIDMPVSVNQESSFNKTKIDDCSQVKASETIQSVEVEKIQEVHKNIETIVQKVQTTETDCVSLDTPDHFPNFKEKCAELFDDSENDNESLNSIAAVITNMGNLHESLANKDPEQEAHEEKVTVQNDDVNFNDGKGLTIGVSNTVDQNVFLNKNSLEVEEKKDAITIGPQNDKILSYNSIDRPEERVSQNLNNDIPDQLKEGSEVKIKHSELQSQVNNTSMDLETAAITIQKVFRSFLFKNKTLSADDSTNVEDNLLTEDITKNNSDIISMNINKDRRIMGLNRIDSVLQTVNEEKSLSVSTDDSSTLSSAATIIQAHVRGFLVRNKFNANKNSSTTSGVDSDGMSLTSVEGENDYRKNKTILNIHIVPESSHFMSRDESVLTSTDLSLDSSPPDSTNLHPLGYDRSERRKQLKREDAIQSVSPPTNNSGKLSEDVDSVKEVLANSENIKTENQREIGIYDSTKDSNDTILSGRHELIIDDNIATMVDNLDTALEVKSLGSIESPVKYLTERPLSLPEMTSDEMDVITPFTPVEEKLSSNPKNYTNLINSSEFHEVVLPTKVSRSDTSVVRGE